MPKSNHQDAPPRSVARHFMIHLGLSSLTFVLLVIVLALAVDLLGDPATSAPEVTMPLFAETKDAPKPPLKQRLREKSREFHHKTHPDQHDAGHASSVNEEAVASRITIIHDNAHDASGIALRAAPIDEVHKRGNFGALPMVSANGLSPAEAYAHPYRPSAGGARIGIVFGGLGQNSLVTSRAINELPPEISLSFVPYARGLQSWIDKARAAGHETLLEIPMEPYDYPNNDPGPHTLLIGNSVNENKRRLSYLLSRCAGYFGLINYQGAKFFTSAQALSPIIREAGNHGLAFIHDGAAPRSRFPAAAEAAAIDFAVADRILDTVPDKKLIDEQFRQLEKLAMEHGQALATGFAYPVTLDLLIDWTKTLPERGFELAPASFFAGVTTENPS